MVFCLSVVLALMILAPGGAAAQPGTTCDDNARAAFASAVKSGAAETQLESQFGHCRTAFQEPVCSSPSASATEGELDSMFSAVKTIINYNTYYEKMNGCGHHPQAEMVGCDVEIRRPTGYGAHPGGTFENVRFCMDCDRNGTWDFTTIGFVHVTDNISLNPVPPWFHLAYATTFAAPALCTNNDGQQTNVRAILSWAWVPTTCNSVPYWGNIINFTARRDP
jgi:hypothetical protein